MLSLGACGGGGNNDGGMSDGFRPPGDGGRDGGGVVGFDFRTDAPAAYARRDRAGMPLVAAGLITDDNGYNLDDPADDVTTMGTPPLPKWAPEIATNLGALHDALRDDFMGAGLTPCADFSGGSANALPCATQEVAAGVSVLSLIVPDTLSIDTSAAAGFPNGRQLSDPVADVTLAVILLDLSVHTPGTLAGLPLNPPANDVAFGASFPYLAAPHTP